MGKLGLDVGVGRPALPSAGARWAGGRKEGWADGRSSGHRVCRSPAFPCCPAQAAAVPSAQGQL